MNPFEPTAQPLANDTKTNTPAGADHPAKLTAASLLVSVISLALGYGIYYAFESQFTGWNGLGFSIGMMLVVGAFHIVGLLTFLFGGIVRGEWHDGWSSVSILYHATATSCFIWIWGVFLSS